MLVQLRLLLLFALCFSTFVQSLLAPKPKFDSNNHLTINRMTEARISTEIAIPSENLSIGIPQLNQKSVVSGIITVSYMSIIVSVMALPVCLAAIAADVNFYGATTSSSYLAELMTVATVAIVSQV